MKPAPKYLADVARRLADGAVTGDGVFHVEVAHDRDCPILAGKGACRCDPSMTTLQREQ
jgi:hypothetical protein